MRKMILAVAMVLSMGWAVVAVAQWRTDWKYNPGDLDGAYSLEEAADDHERRFDALGLNATNDYTTANVTNGQAVTISASYFATVLSSVNKPDTETNEVTLAAPTATQMAMIVNDQASTNLISIANGGTWDSATIVLAAGEGVLIHSLGTNGWVAVK